MTMPDGTEHKVGVIQKMGSWMYNPVYTEEIVGYNVGTQEKVTGYKSATITNADGTTTEVKEPIIEIVPYKEPIFQNVVSSWEPNLLGQALKMGAGLIPFPGAEEAAGSALALGSLGMGVQEIFRRRRKKITDSDASDQEKKIQIVKAEKDAVEENFHITVGGIKKFLKSDAGEAGTKALKGALKDKAAEFGKAGEFKAAVGLIKQLV